MVPVGILRSVASAVRWYSSLSATSKKRRSTLPGKSYAVVLTDVAHYVVAAMRPQSRCARQAFTAVAALRTSIGEAVLLQDTVL